MPLCQFVATSAGVGDFVVSAATAGHMTPVNAKAKDGNTYIYYAVAGEQYERGIGTWVLATNTLQRTAVKDTSNYDTEFVKINFATAPTVDVYPAPAYLEIPAVDPVIPAATNALFQQTAAPTGWTKLTTHNDKALRVVSGTASSGGTNAFSSMFASRTSDAHTLTTGEMPSHAHSERITNLTNFVARAGADASAYVDAGGTTGSAGSGGSHTHTYDMRVQYVDIIIASKDAFTP